MSASNSFLSDFWVDVVALLSVLGLIGTAFGLWLAWKQLRRTRTALVAATSAALREREGHRLRYRHHVVATLSRVLRELNQYVTVLSWHKVDLRIEDAADFMSQLAQLDLAQQDACRQAVKDLRTWQATFRSLTEKSEMTVKLRTQWNRDYISFMSIIDSHCLPLPESAGDEHHG